MNFKLVFSLLCAMYICSWLIQNHYHKVQLKQMIQLEGYFERFNQNDKTLRNNMTLEQYVDSTRILYPWEFSKYKNKILIFDKHLEGGFPHTHGHYIMAPSIKFLTPTILKHEQMHIYQRFNPLEVNKNIVKDRPIVGIINPASNCRANPDTNCLKYTGISAEYIDEPKTLLDLKDKSDHPYEEIAYQVK